MPKLSVDQVARELTAVAHGKALYAIQPVLHLATAREREIVFRAMDDEFAGLRRTVEDLLNHSVLKFCRGEEARHDAGT